MTCLSFQTVREYIVGKTAPMPVKVYDYYEPGWSCQVLIGRPLFLAKKTPFSHFLTACSVADVAVRLGSSPAFEATRFYNVSENSPLARELCDGTTCNEVESSANRWIGEPAARRISRG